MTAQAPAAAPGAAAEPSSRAKADRGPDVVAAQRQGHRSAAFVLALVIGAFIIVVQRRRRDRVAEVLRQLPVGLLHPRPAHAIGTSYWALVKGSVGSGHAIGTTLDRSAPLICAGLGVTLAFRAGLFNIGAQGQLIIGALRGRLRRLHLEPAARHPPAGGAGRGRWSAGRSGAASPASSRPAPAPTRSSPRS